MRNKTIGLAMVTALVWFGCAVNGYAQVTAGVICGLKTYKNFGGTNYGAEDANDIYRKCIELGVSSKNIKLLLDSKATKKGIQSGIKSASKKVLPGQVFLFYFSGFGWTGPTLDPVGEPDGLEEYIGPYDSSKTTYAYDIRDDELEEWLTPITYRGATVLVILDSSFSGGMAQGLSNSDGTGRRLPVKTLLDRSIQGESAAGGFVRSLTKPGIVVMTAASPGGKAYEWRWFQNSIFTHLILAALDGPADDSFFAYGSGNDDRVITDTELFNAAVGMNNVYFNILDRTGQAPQVYGNGGVGLFYLR